ncbi:MAG: aldehyde ferredoxin oxidoreductase [Anaerolineales bacterium]|nr:aldehyde ferredoxin oxidoreductase [Anaerolineales bacterium]
MQKNIWRANITKQVVSKERIPENWMRLGGRGLIPRIMLDETDPGFDPLGPSSKLIFAPGLLAGHMVSSCDRISIGGKSPLTGGIKESNAGGSTGLKLARLGIHALVIEGQLEDETWWILRLNSEGGTFEPAKELVGLGVYEASERLLERYGKRVGIALIGPGGERGFLSAGIQNLDKDNEPSRISARGGLGALMGSKRLKAIIIDDDGTSAPPLVNKELFKAAQKKYTDALLEHPQIATYAQYGTAAMASMCDGFGALPTRGFSSGHFEAVEQISGEMMRDLLIERGGESNTSHACMAGCVILCSNCFGDEDGKAIVSPLEFETIGLIGSNLGIDSLDSIAKINRELNDLGCDTIEVGAALGVAADAGLMEYGDVRRALELIGEMRSGTPLGRMLGSGAARTAEELGISRVPAVKGQALSAYDPRAIKGTGVTYATSPQGADHTSGLTIRKKINHLKPEGQVDISRAAQISSAGYDSLGVCSFGTFGFAEVPDTIPNLLNGRYDWDVGDDILTELGCETLRLERTFNRAAGFTKKDDRLPDWLNTEPLPPHNSVFDVPDQELYDLFDW